MSPDQIAFVRLHHAHKHSNDWIEETRYLFQESMIRVKTRLGKRATLARDAVLMLIDTGFMVPSHGGSFVLTDKGKAI
jgi:hypothetical protein